MDKKLVILILAFFVNALSVTAIHSTEISSKTLLPEDFVLRGVEGKLIPAKAVAGAGLVERDKDLWFFDFSSVANEKKEGLDIKETLEVLPSSVLEAVIADVNLSAAGYKIRGRVTKYKGRNFIFPTDLSPLGEVKDSNSLSSVITQEQTQTSQKQVSEPNDDLGIPKDILEKLKTSSRAKPALSNVEESRDRSSLSDIRLHRPEKQVPLRRNYILVNRTGFLEKSDNGSMVFKLDALGLGVQRTLLQLLPCEVLESAERIQSAEPDRVRFSVAGIVTEYKGRKYLLLQRATRVYTYGNFGR